MKYVFVVLVVLAASVVFAQDNRATGPTVVDLNDPAVRAELQRQMNAAVVKAQAEAQATGDARAKAATEKATKAEAALAAASGAYDKAEKAAAGWKDEAESKFSFWWLALAFVVGVLVGLVLMIFGRQGGSKAVLLAIGLSLAMAAETPAEELDFSRIAAAGSSSPFTTLEKRVTGLEESVSKLVTRFDAFEGGLTALRKSVDELVAARKAEAEKAKAEVVAIAARRSALDIGCVDTAIEDVDGRRKAAETMAAAAEKDRAAIRTRLEAALGKIGGTPPATTPATAAPKPCISKDEVRGIVADSLRSATVEVKEKGKETRYTGSITLR